MNWRSLICRARLFGTLIVGHDDGRPVYVSRGLMAHRPREREYVCKRCGHVTKVIEC